MDELLMAKSTHQVLVVPVKLEPHPNADNLSIVKIDAYSVVVRTSDWININYGAYIPPDSIVKTTRPEFSFLKREGRDSERITVKKLRGYVSMGLLVFPPANSKIGDDVAAQLEVTHYEPPIEISSYCEAISPPRVYAPYYDIESLRKYPKIFNDDETVYISEKIHGANSRYCWYDGQMYCGSHKEWKKPNDKSIVWIAYSNCPQIKTFCYDNQNCVLYGEVYGKVQSLRYGLPNSITFAAFDIMCGNTWLSVSEFKQRCDEYNIPRVPELYVGPYSFNVVEQLAEGKSLIPTADHIREGCVIKPIVERTNPEIGRVALKLVSNKYLEKQF